MRTQLTYARLLLQTRRYREAESALRQALAGDPSEAEAHALLALALYHQARYPEALQAAQAAIGLAPEEAHHHYVAACVLLEQDRLAECSAAIHQALRLEPENPTYYALLSSTHVRAKDWQAALQAAESGLRFDAEHIECSNLRGLALVKLGRQAEAGQVIAGALAREPENAATHANQGWALLHSGQAEQAFVHFRQALRLDPTSNWARAGIVEALKARHRLYRWMLRYFLWMSSLTSEEQWGVIGTIYAVRLAASMLASASCLLRIVFLPLDLLYQAFVVLSWTARPFFALLLRFDRLGRLALSDEERAASSWLAVCLLAAGGSAIAGLLLRNAIWLVPLLVALSMIVPVAGTSQSPPGGRRVFLIVYTAGLGGLGVGLSGLALTGTPVGLGLAIGLALVYIAARTAYTWLAIILLSLG